MGTSRLEAFSDGVIAVIITIMVLELHAPHGADLDALRPLLPGFLVYLLSFVFVGIYWNNHHHMLHVATKVDGRVLWANLHLLFWLSLMPFTTSWMGSNHEAALPTAVYGADLLLSGIAYLFVERAIIRAEGKDSKLAAAVGTGIKEQVSTLFYVAAIPLAFVNTWISDALFVCVAAVWFIPDRRIEQRLQHGAER
jgi:uncharacterized membrane protein